MDYIEKELKKVKTEPTHLQHIMNMIKNWRKTIQLPEHASNTPYYAELVEAHEDQKNIGFEAFAKGYVSMKWQKVQDIYYRKEIRKRKYNIKRWNNTILTLIIDRGNILWEERCEIIHTAKINTDERRCRELLMDLLVQTRDRKIINLKDYHILQRKRKFFMPAPKQTLEMWYLRLMGVITFKKERRKKEGSDIQKFMVRKKRRRRQRIQTDQPKQKSYQQQTLWNTISMRKNPPAASQPRESLQQNMNTHKQKRILKNLVRKRKQQSQTTIDGSLLHRHQKQKNDTQAKKTNAKCRKQKDNIRLSTYKKRQKN